MQMPFSMRAGQTPQVPSARTPSPLSHLTQFGQSPAYPLSLSQVHSVALIVLIVAGIAPGMFPPREQFATKFRLSSSPVAVGNCGGSPNIVLQGGKESSAPVMAQPVPPARDESSSYNMLRGEQTNSSKNIKPPIDHPFAVQASAMSATSLAKQPASVLFLTTLSSSGHSIAAQTPLLFVSCPRGHRQDTV